MTVPSSSTAALRTSSTVCVRAHAKHADVVDKRARLKAVLLRADLAVLRRVAPMQAQAVSRQLELDAHAWGRALALDAAFAQTGLFRTPLLALAAAGLLASGALLTIPTVIPTIAQVLALVMVVLPLLLAAVSSPVGLLVAVRINPSAPLTSVERARFKQVRPAAALLVPAAQGQEALSRTHGSGDARPFDGVDAPLAAAVLRLRTTLDDPEAFDVLLPSFAGTLGELRDVVTTL